MNASLVTESSKIENGLNVNKSDNIRTIEWDMLDKKRFYPCTILTSLVSRSLVYPNQLIRTRLQMQHGTDMYKGTADAYRKIVSKEGVYGLYRGFWFSTLYLVPGLCFITIYEGVRHLLEVNGVHDSRIKAMIGGGSAAAVSQTLFVPLDIISQHLQVQGMVNKTALGSTVRPYVGYTVNGVDVMKNIYRRDGCKGFYRGYYTSLLLFVPSSASWWTFYYVYQDAVADALPPWFHHSAVQGLAGVAASCSTALLLNPLDLLRARVQMERRSVVQTLSYLWRTERWAIFHKGLTARMVSGTISNFFMICGYETVKKLCVYKELRDKILW